MAFLAPPAPLAFLEQPERVAPLVNRETRARAVLRGGLEQVDRLGERAPPAPRDFLVRLEEMAPVARAARDQLAELVTRVRRVQVAVQEHLVPRGLAVRRDPLAPRVRRVPPAVVVAEAILKFISWQPLQAPRMRSSTRLTALIGRRLATRWGLEAPRATWPILQTCCSGLYVGPVRLHWQCRVLPIRYPSRVRRLP